MTPEPVTPPLWCHWCGQRVTVSGEGPGAKAVHAATGDVRGGPEGHAATPVDSEPQIWRDAREITALYGGVFDVSARFGRLCAYWADLPPGAVAGHIMADDRWDMIQQLNRALGRELLATAARAAGGGGGETSAWRRELFERLPKQGGWPLGAAREVLASRVRQALELAQDGPAPAGSAEPGEESGP